MLLVVDLELPATLAADGVCAFDASSNWQECGGVDRADEEGGSSISTSVRTRFLAA